jgi:hypothetical protein
MHFPPLGETGMSQGRRLQGGEVKETAVGEEEIDHGDGRWEEREDGRRGRMGGEGGWRGDGWSLERSKLERRV